MVKFPSCLPAFLIQTFRQALEKPSGRPSTTGIGCNMTAKTNRNSIILPICFIVVSTLLRLIPSCLAEDASKPNIPENEVFYFKMGTKHIQSRAFDLAVKDYTECVRINPTNIEAYAARGYCYIALHDWDKAIGDFTQQIQSQPTNALAFLNRGNAYRANGEFEKALPDFNECLRLDPKNYNAYGSRATIYNYKQEYDKVIKDLNQAIHLYSEREVALDTIYVMRGLAHQHRKEFASAVEDFHKAIQINPKNGDAFNDLSWIRATCHAAEMRDGKEAVEMATKACELTDWMHWEYLDTLAVAFAEAGDFEKAVKYEKTAFDMIANSAGEQYGIQKRLSLFEQKKAYRQDD